MIDTFVNARRLKNAYTKNSFIYWVKTVPFVGKLIPNAAYGSGFVEVLATIYFWIKTVLGFCITHFLYALAVFGISLGIRFGTEVVFFKNLWFFMAIIGIFLNSKLFEPSEDKYYGIMLMRMDAREYILSDMIYTAIRQIIGYILVPIVATLAFDLPVLCGLSLVAFSVFGKIFGCFMKLFFLRKEKNRIYNTICVFVTLGTIALTFYTLTNDIQLANEVIYIAAAVMVVLGTLSFIYMWNYKNYKSVCKVFLSEKSMIKFRQAKSGKAQPKISTESRAKKLINLEEAGAVAVDASLTSSADGYKYFNQIFERRHASILGKRTKIICFGILIVEMIVVGLIIYFKSKGQDLFDSYTGVTFVMPFVMYFLNTGEVLASAMFYNCDAAMLTYNFYRKPETILGVFKERLKTVIKHNMLPAVLLAAGLCLLIFLSPAENKLEQCATFLILVPSLSIFFSVHRLVIYYLLQPFTVGQEKKSSAYTLINAATYFVAYVLLQNAGNLVESGLSPLKFSIASFVFSLIYVVIALLLVYKFAPKRFRLH